MPAGEQWLLAIFLFLSIPVGIAYIIIKPISRLIATVFKIPCINLNIYLIAGTFLTMFNWNKNNMQLNITFFGYAALIAFLLKTPFLPECKPKSLQKKLEKNVIIISFITFILGFVIISTGLIFNINI